MFFLAINKYNEVKREAGLGWSIFNISNLGDPKSLLDFIKFSNSESATAPVCTLL
jgi:hypothetical protein